MWEFHVNESAESKYGMLLGRDILIALGINLKFCYCIIEVGDRPVESWTSIMVDFGIHEFKILNTDNITSKYPLLNAYVEELFE